MRVQRTCAICGRVYRGDPRSKYCSVRCRKKGVAEYQRTYMKTYRRKDRMPHETPHAPAAPAAPSAPPIPTPVVCEVCEVCGAAIHDRRSAKYCSEECQRIAQKNAQERKRAEMRAFREHLRELEEEARERGRQKFSKALDLAICERCGEAYEKSDPDARGVYCSARCERLAKGPREEKKRKRPEPLWRCLWCGELNHRDQDGNRPTRCRACGNVDFEDVTFCHDCGRVVQGAYRCPECLARWRQKHGVSRDRSCYGDVGDA